ncbi:MAG: DNA-3-methyladenine glycosylase 2 family protein [Patescibacteria group bacterium]
MASQYGKGEKRAKTAVESRDLVRERAALAHLKRADPILYTASLPHRGLVASRVQPKRTRDQLFRSLVSSITSQQLSGKAAATIFARLETAVGGTLTPVAVQATHSVKLRAAGLSEAKVRALTELSESILSGELNLLALKKQTPEEAVHTLTSHRGIGPWTAEMFLIFAVGSPDVFSAGDLILARMTEELHGLPKGSHRKELERIAARWSPHRSYVSLLLWKLHHAKK